MGFYNEEKSKIYLLFLCRRLFSFKLFYIHISGSRISVLLSLVKNNV